MIKRFLNYFTTLEKVLWCSSVVLIVSTFFIFENDGYLTLIASIIGVTSLILNAKGNPIGQVLIIIFSFLYGYISFSFAYYGEMITYIGMSAPMAFIALVTWMKNPYNNNKSQVKINKVSAKEFVLILVVSLIVTIGFYFILLFLGTSSLIASTISVTTSFVAACLTFRRSPYYALAYAANDIILIILWVIAAIEDISYLSVIICFVVFLVNDSYAFINWLKMQKKQSA